MIDWLEAHDKLAGWAQFAGAILALGVTYFTAFIPIWNRKRQLRKAADRLLLHGYEVLESYHRTTAKFLPTALSLRGGVLVITGVMDEIARFPVYELDDQGSRSRARHLVATTAQLLAVRLFFENLATQVGDEEATAEQRDELVYLIGDRLEAVRQMLAGEELKRPTWPAPGTSES